MYAMNPAGINWSDPTILPSFPCAGLGCAGMGGLFDGTGFLGTGLFESSDISTWSTGEIVAIALGFFVVYSVFSTTSRGVSTVSRKVKYVAATGERRRQSKAARLRAQARALEGEGGGKSKKRAGFF
jgi:hypothetical protein